VKRETLASHGTVGLLHVCRIISCPSLGTLPSQSHWGQSLGVLPLLCPLLSQPWEEVHQQPWSSLLLTLLYWAALVGISFLPLIPTGQTGLAPASKFRQQCPCHPLLSPPCPHWQRGSTPSSINSTPSFLDPHALDKSGLELVGSDRSLWIVC
jgi:hypothetical protein